jgi:sec-independent protein translocase protein TatC
MANRTDMQDPLTIPNSASQQGEEEEEEGLATMSLIDHLEELRWRILKTLIAILIGSIIAFIFKDWLIKLLEAPLPDTANSLGLKTGHPLVVTGLTEGFTTYLLISIVVGTVLALPVLLYQTWAFIAPGLYAHEKKNAVPFIFIGLGLFAAGISLGYIVLRYPIQWLVNFAADSFTPLVTAGSYFTFVAVFILIFGLVFELPLVLTFLAKVGIVSRETLQKKRSMAHITMWLISTFITPGADFYSPIILAVVMSFLYELTIIFIRFFIKEDATEDA